MLLTTESERALAIVCEAAGSVLQDCKVCLWRAAVVRKGWPAWSQVDTLPSETQSCSDLLDHPNQHIKAGPRVLPSAPSFSPCWVASQKPAWFHTGHALGSLPILHGPSQGGTRGCSFSSCCQASHSLAGAPQLLLPEGGCEGCAHNKAPAETIAQECVRFLTNTVWARTIALDSRPRNTFHSARVRVACLPQPAHISLYAKDLDEGWPVPHPDLHQRT